MHRVEERELTIRLVNAAERMADGIQRIAAALEAGCSIQAGNPSVKAAWYVRGNSNYEEPKNADQ